MSFEELQKLWTNQAFLSVPPLDEAALLQRLKADSSDFDRTIARRDRYEMLAGLLLLVFFGARWEVAPGALWAQVLAMALIAGVTATFFVISRRVARQRDRVGGTLTEQFDWAVRHVRLQILMLRTVAWWYLAPLAIASLAHNYARAGELHPTHWVTFGLMLASFVFVYWINQRAVTRSLQPRLEKLLALRADWRAAARDVDNGH